MSQIVSGLGLSLLLGSLWLTASAWVAPGDPSLQSAPAQGAGNQLAKRLEGDRQLLRADLEKIQALPWREAWYAELAKQLEGAPKAKWIPARRGWFPRRTVEFAQAWNQPAPGRELERCVDFELESHPFGTIVDLHRQLLAQNIELIVVPIPTRLQVYPEDLFAAETELEPSTSALAEGSYRLLLALSEAGIEVVNLAPVFFEERYLEADPAAGPAGASEAGASEAGAGPTNELFLDCNSHWSPRGARLAAELVAGRIRQLPSWQVPEGAGLGDFELSYAEGFVGAPRGARLPVGAMPDRVRFECILTPAGVPLELFDKTSPLLVIGDSFVKYFEEREASFAAHLAANLGHKIDKISVSGGGVLQARQALLRRSSKRRVNGLETKRILVWLFTTANFANAQDWERISFFEGSR